MDLPLAQSENTILVEAGGCRNKCEKSANVGADVAIVAELPKGPRKLPDQHLVPDDVLNEMCPFHAEVYFPSRRDT